MSAITSDMNGNYSITLPEGNYSVNITAPGYIESNTYATVTKDETTYIETFLLIEGSETETGVASGKVIDSLTGTGISDVTLTVKNDWNNTNSDAPVITTTTTNTNGNYSLELPIGNYSVIATKEGYETSSFNIIVQGGITENQNGTIIPITSEDEDAEEKPIFGKGDGTSSNPYQITTETEFLNIAEEPEAYYILMNDIVVSSDTNIENFSGNLDGNGHTLTLSTNTPLVNNIEDTGVIHDLICSVSVSLDINNKENCTKYGSICITNNGIIQNCVVMGNINEYSIIMEKIGGEPLIIGGICSENIGIIRNCKSEIDIDFSSGIVLNYVGAQIGGIAGSSWNKIENCWNAGNITVKIIDGSNYYPAWISYVGGICGSGGSYGIKNCAQSSNIMFHYKSFGGSYFMNVGFINGSECMVEGNDILHHWGNIGENNMVSKNSKTTIIYEERKIPYKYSLDINKWSKVVDYSEIQKWWDSLSQTESDEN